MFELVSEYNQNAEIKVIGVGGGGGNAVISMLESKIVGAEFIVANTDSQALAEASKKGATMIQIGSDITKGLGAGADPEKGRQAALEAKEELAAAMSGADMLFIAAGMGGGTGTGAAPVIAQLAREAGILTVAVVSKPYEFEGVRRTKHAEEGITALSEWVDSLIVIPNEKLAEVYGSDDSIFLDYKNMTNGWEYDNPVEFSFDSPAEAVNISIMLRTDKSYPFSNIFIKSQIVSEDNQIVDTIELDLKQEKRTLFSGNSLSLNNHSFIIAKNISFKKSKVTVKLNHANRFLDSINAVKNLDGILSVGLLVDNYQNEEL